MPAPTRAILALASSAILLVGAGRADVYCECLPATSPCGNHTPSVLPAGCTNSTGKRAYLGAIGSLSISTDDLVLSSFGLPAQVPTLLLMGGGTRSLPFGDGLLCVSAGGKGLYSFSMQHAGPTGAVAAGPGLALLAQTSFPKPGWIQPGDTWHFQRWYRDPHGPCGGGFNLTNALELRFVP
jgi:hypothetical protein